MRNELDRARDALYAIPPDLPREGWVKAGMAAHACGLGFDDFNSWSAPAPSYNAQACRTTWRSFKAGKGVSAGSLFGMARDHGWTDDNASPRPAPAKPIKPTVETPKQPAKGNSASEVFNRLEPATNQHGYLVAKQADGVPLDCLRVVPMDSQLRIAGEGVAGYLAVPAFAPDGSIQSIQFIPANGGKKLNLPGASMSGASFTVGTEGTMYLCEGAGQAWAAWKATGHRAVCCFGAGNIRRVVESMRQREPDAKLIVCPDRGKESDAKKIATEFNCSVACLPECELNNFDLNDQFCRDGFDVVQSLLESVTEPAKPEPKVHPLARFIDLNSTPKPPRWVIPGFVGHGVTVIAGAHGVGKTTALLPLAMTAAGLHGDELLPRQWRHVIYVSEDTEQARRILTGIVNHGNLNISMETVRERIHIVEAVRLDPAFVAAVGSTYREQFTRTVEDVEVLPLVVLDTKSAVLALDNENDNAEASRMMAALKQGFDGLPVWLIGHVAKANLGRSDVAALTSRGASAIEGDANQTMFLVREGECRYLVLGKVRVDAD